MRAFPNYNEVSEFTEELKLPAGAYEVTIIRAEERTSNDSCALCILFDISGGEYKNFYHNKLAQDKKNFNIKDAKYKGVYRLWYPNGSEYDENIERRMKTALKIIKETNNLNVDFTKEWNGAILKDCKVGMIFQNQQWEINGKTGFTAQPYQIISLENLKEGKFRVPEPKYLKNNTPINSYSYKSVEEFDNDLDLPF